MVQARAFLAFFFFHGNELWSIFSRKVLSLHHAVLRLPFSFGPASFLLHCCLTLYWPASRKPVAGNQHSLFHATFNTLEHGAVQCSTELSASALILAEHMRAPRAAAPWTQSTDWLSRCCEPWKRDCFFRTASTCRSGSHCVVRQVQWQQINTLVLKVAWSGL